MDTNKIRGLVARLLDESHDGWVRMFRDECVALDMRSQMDALLADDEYVRMAVREALAKVCVHTERDVAGDIASRVFYHSYSLTV